MPKFLDRFAAIAFTTVVATTSTVGVHAQTWPTKPVRMIVPYPGGGGVDVLARVLSDGLSKKWNQPVVVDTKPGANTVLGADLAARAKDGHTLLFTTDATFTINPYIYSKLPYDPIKDFIPITQLVSFSQLMVTNSKFPANSIKDVIVMAKDKPGTMSYASYGSGSQPNLAMEMFKKRAGIDIVHVPYRGLAPAMNAVLAGEVPFTFTGVASGQGYIKAGSMKALAYAGKKRLAEFPDVPTFTELGYPEVDANVWIGVFAPAGTPDAQVQQINRDILAVISEPEFKATQIIAKGYDFTGLGPKEFANYIAGEYASRAELVKTSGAKAD